MRRVLTTVRVTVPASHRDTYRECLTALAVCHAARGNRLWLFELRGEPGTYLECSEGGEDHHRHLGPATPTEQQLEARLAALGSYEDPGDRWEELSLSPHPKE